MSDATTPKTIIVTGAGSGIGYAVAEAFLKRGANVVLNGRTEAKLQDAAEHLRHADQIAIAPGDITRSETGQQLVDAAVERFGRLDVLFNNAGIFESKPFTDYSVDELDGYLGYLRGTFLGSQAAAQQMRRNGGGAIINITTILTLNGVKAIPSSAPIAAKGGINALTKSLAIELAPDNIRVNAVAPGIVPTPLYGELSDEQRAALHTMQPLGRYGEVSDIADAVLYLADASWVTGVILPVDGGVAAGGDGTAGIAA
ncbi:MAG: SDR family oxidoreductase [Planctomycetes bacterium]|nr:SDR family oxidoreductase [Planctomycetota bacterium]